MPPQREKDGNHSETPQSSRSASGHLPSRAAVLPGRPPGVLPEQKWPAGKEIPISSPRLLSMGRKAPSPGPSSILSSNGKGNLRSSCKGPTPGTQARLTGNYIQDLSDTLNQDTTDVIDDIPNWGWKTFFLLAWNIQEDSLCYHTGSVSIQLWKYYRSCSLTRWK